MKQSALNSKQKDQATIKPGKIHQNLLFEWPSKTCFEDMNLIQCLACMTAFLCLFTCLIAQPCAMLFLACLTHSSFHMRGRTMSLVRAVEPVSEFESTLYILTYSQNKDAACEAFTTCFMSVQFPELQAPTQVFATGQTQP